MNELYYGDNLKILREHFKDESIDLVYLDPPFNSKANYNILYKSPEGDNSESQIRAFDDTWHWTEETELVFQEIIKTAASNVVDMVISFRKFIKENDMLAYLVNMAVRLIELKRVLKKSGSIYLHCDPTASHYLKVLMDGIFGPENFINEIVWCFTGPSKNVSKFPKKHNIIFRYSRSDEAYFNPESEFARRPYSDSFLARRKYKEGSAGIFKGKSEDGHDIDEYSSGKLIEDWWSDIPSGGQIPRTELLGYPTQKPIKLLKRIIDSSCPESGIVLDPFCGCGTTIDAAQTLKRKWVGIDITHLAINLIKKRIKDIHNIDAKIDFEVIGEPTSLSGAKELAAHDKYQFQWWITSYIGARPYDDGKKGADGGIDAIDYFYTMEDGKEKVEKIIISVKGGNVQVSQVRDLKAVVERENAAMGFFITLENPTRPMKEEAVRASFYEDIFTNKKYRKIQILTVEDIMAGERFDVPIAKIVHNKKAREKKQGQKILSFDK